MKKIYTTLAVLLATVNLCNAQWSTGSGTIYTTTSTDKVGIGNSSPSTKLQISGGDLAIDNGHWYNAANTAGVVSPIMGVNGSAMFIGDIFANINGSLNFRTSGIDRLVLNGSGNVGIGTVNPNYLFDVNGVIHATGDLIITQSSTAGVGAQLINSNTGGYSTLTLQNNGTSGKAFQIGLGGHSSGQADKLYVYNVITGAVPFAIDQNGYVGIGTSSPQEALSVNGNIRSKQIKVELSNWPDYVFKPTYTLPTLESVKVYIDQNHHLPEIPSEQEVAKNGLNLGEMNVLLTKKVEELTLYLIEKDRQLKAQERRLRKIEVRLNSNKK